MSYEIACPSCGERLQLDEHLADRRVRCPGCHSEFIPSISMGSPSMGSHYPGQPARGSGMAVAALVLGIIGMVGWCLPICGFPINLAGLILGIMGQKSPNRGMAITGAILSGIGLILTLINAALGAYMAIQNQGGGFAR
jgi:hypothetical protein